MGLILDTNILINAERRGQTVANLVTEIATRFPQHDLALSVITIVEIDHGICRARNETNRIRRREFSELLIQALIILPVTLAIAQLAGRIDGEQAAQGISLPFEDLLIGAAALYFGDSVLRHMQLIPGLPILPF